MRCLSQFPHLPASATSIFHIPQMMHTTMSSGDGGNRKPGRLTLYLHRADTPSGNCLISPPGQLNLGYAKSSGSAYGNIDFRSICRTPGRRGTVRRVATKWMRGQFEGLKICKGEILTASQKEILQQLVVYAGSRTTDRDSEYRRIAEVA